MVLSRKTQVERDFLAIAVRVGVLHGIAVGAQHRVPDHVTTGVGQCFGRVEVVAVDCKVVVAFAVADRRKAVFSITVALRWCAGTAVVFRYQPAAEPQIFRVLRNISCDCLSDPAVERIVLVTGIPGRGTRPLRVELGTGQTVKRVVAVFGYVAGFQVRLADAVAVGVVVIIPGLAGEQLVEVVVLLATLQSVAVRVVLVAVIVYPVVRRGQAIGGVVAVLPVGPFALALVQAAIAVVAVAELGAQAVSKLLVLPAALLYLVNDKGHLF